jgi:hypothetical protein
MNIDNTTKMFLLSILSENAGETSMDVDVGPENQEDYVPLHGKSKKLTKKKLGLKQPKIVAPKNIQGFVTSQEHAEDIDALLQQHTDDPDTVEIEKLGPEKQQTQNMQPGMPQQGMGQPGMPQQGMPQQGMPQQGMGQPGMPGMQQQPEEQEAGWKQINSAVLNAMKRKLEQLKISQGMRI